MTKPITPFLYGFLIKTRDGTRLEKPPRDLGRYLAFSIDRAAEAVLGLWTREETKERLSQVVENIDGIEGIDHFRRWYEKRGGRIGITAMDKTVKKPSDKEGQTVAERTRTMNLTKRAAYDPNDSRFRASFSANRQLTMGIKGRARGNYRNEPPIREGSFYYPVFLDGRLKIHPHAGQGSCCLDSGEHRAKIRDFETEVVCYHNMGRLTRASWESRGLVDLTIEGWERGKKVINPFDFLQAPELVFEAFTRRYVDGQDLWQISFELAKHYEKILTPEAKKLLKEGRGYFGLMPLTRSFSDVGDAIKERAIRSLWRDESGNVRYDFLGHGIEDYHPETEELLGEKPVESFIYLRRGKEDIPQRKRVHIVVNPKTELAYYIFKVPLKKKNELLKGKRPLANYEENCPAFRNRVFCAVFRPRDKDLDRKLAQVYKKG